MRIYSFLIFYYRTVGKVLRKKSQSKESQYLVERVLERNVTVKDQLMNTLSSSMKLCLCCESTVEITKHCNIVSYLNDRGISCNHKKHFLVRKLHQSMLCRSKNFQNLILNQNLGVRSIHNLSTSDLFGSGDKVLKIDKPSQKETDSQEEYTLKLESKTAKGSRHPRKRKGSSEDIKGEYNKTTDSVLNGEESEDITSKGMCSVMFPHPHVRYVCQVSLKRGSLSLIINMPSVKIKA